MDGLALAVVLGFTAPFAVALIVFVSLAYIRLFRRFVVRASFPCLHHSLLRHCVY